MLHDFMDTALASLDTTARVTKARQRFWRRKPPVMEGNKVVKGGMWPHQREFWELDTFFRVLVGGYGSGKTSIGGKWIISMALQNYGVPVAAVSPSFPLARKTIIPTIIELLSGKQTILGSELQWKFRKSPSYEFEISHKGRHSLIYILSGENEESLRGPNLGGALIDEPFIQPLEVFQQMVARVRHPKASMPALALTGCVTRDSIILTKDGFKAIGDLDPGCKAKQYKSLGVDIYGRGGFHEATKFYNNGLDDTIKLQLRNGYELEATPDHPVLTMGEFGVPEFKRLGDRKGKYGYLDQIKMGDFVAVARGMEVWGDKDPCIGFTARGQCKNGTRVRFGLDADMAYGLGLWVAEGSYFSKWNDTFVITCGDKSVMDHFMIEGLAGVVFRQGERKDQCRRCSEDLADFFRHIGMPLVKSPKRYIPQWVWQARREHVVQFLSGMYDGDGHVCKDGKSGIGYSTTSKRLAKELQILLTNFGIVVSIRPYNNPPTAKSKVWSMRYQVMAVAQNAKKLASLLKFRIKRKREQARLYLRHYRDNDVIPMQAQLLLAAWKKRTKYKWTRGNSSLEPNKMVESAKKGSGALSYGLIEDFVNCWNNNEPGDCAEIKVLGSNLREDYYWAPIQVLEQSENHTVDVVIPDTNSFTPNGLLSLQTPEQLNWGYDLCLGDLKEEYEKRGLKVGVVKASTRANLAVGEAYVNRLLGTFSGKAADAYVDGEFINLSKGQVYYGFNGLSNDETSNVRDLPIPRNKDGEITAELGCGMDFNVNPFAFVLFWKSGPHMHFFDEYELDNADTEYACQVLKDNYWEMGLRNVYPDASGSARRTNAPGGKTDFHYIEQAGFVVQALHKNPKHRDRENSVNGKLRPKQGTPTLTISPKCKHLRKYLGTYTHELKLKQKHMTHLLDALGYPVYYHFPVSNESIQAISLKGF